MKPDTTSHKKTPWQMAMPELLRGVLSEREHSEKKPVIVAFCFSDSLPLKACFAGCRQEAAVPVVMATLNQVNLEGGYSGLTAEAFVRHVLDLAEETGYDGPVVFGRDHGGPYIIEARKRFSRKEEMQWVRENISMDLAAGFTCWHADGTSGRSEELSNGRLPLEVVSTASLELIDFCEKERRRQNLGPLSYEVGSEEQKGGLTAPDAFDRFLGLMRKGLAEKDLSGAGIDFVVAQTGTRMSLFYRRQSEAFELVQDGFSPEQVALLDRVAQKYRTPRMKLLFTQHYSDHITAADAAELCRFGAGKVNFGPEMTMPELGFLLDWDKKEREIWKRKGLSERASGFRSAILSKLDGRPDFWHKFIPQEGGFPKEGWSGSVFELPQRIQDALAVFRGRYVKSLPECRKAAQRLLSNTAELGIDPDPEKTIVDHIRDTIMVPRLGQLQMTGLRNRFHCNDRNAGEGKG
jgi:hypothetical protein